MHVIIDLCVVPLGVGASVSPYVAECARIIDASGLEHRLHAFGTNIEGPWDEVMSVVRQCHEAVHAMGAPRITTTLHVGTRTDAESSIAGRIDRVESLLGKG
ncbi:MTH1187 family thiamine-binding protein [Halomonas shantousis]